MSFEQFDTTTIEETRKKYAAEAKERWGNSDAYAEFEKKTSHYSDEQFKIMDAKGMDILKEFGQNRTLAPDSVQAQALVEKWHKYITENYFTCTKEILSCLGQMYIGDERFKQNIDRYGEGTAAFMAASIGVYTS